MPVKIDYEKCYWQNGKCECSCGCNDSCEGCAEVCPTKAITREAVVKIDNSKCTECGACIKACQFNALSLIQE